MSFCSITLPIGVRFMLRQSSWRMCFGVLGGRLNLCFIVILSSRSSLSIWGGVTGSSWSWYVILGMMTVLMRYVAIGPGVYLDFNCCSAILSCFVMWSIIFFGFPSRVQCTPRYHVSWELSLMSVISLLLRVNRFDMSLGLFGFQLVIMELFSSAIFMFQSVMKLMMMFNWFCRVSGVDAIGVRSSANPVTVVFVPCLRVYPFVSCWRRTNSGS